jgi:TolB-like protein
LTSTKIKDYYNTYNSASNNNPQITNVKEKKVMFPNNLQINSTSLEDLNKYSDFANYNNGLTNDMTSELSEFLNNLKL